MGAHDFETWATGRDPDQAYENAVAAAVHQSGHDAYNGTISTTEGYEMVPPVDALKPDQLIELIWACEQHGDVPRPPIRRAFQSDYDRKAHEHSKKLYARWSKLEPAQRAALVTAAHSIEKWGPALCIEVHGKAATDYKANVGRKGTRDRVFVFFGLAAS